MTKKSDELFKAFEDQATDFESAKILGGQKTEITVYTTWTDTPSGWERDSAYD